MTGRLGTTASAPGSLVPGWAPVTGTSTSGPAPKTTATTAVPQATATVAKPAGA